MIGDSGKAVVEAVEFFPGEFEAQLPAALAERMTPAVLTQYELAFRHPDRTGVDDLVGGLFLQIAVLVDTGLMRESIPADDGLIRLRTESDGVGEQFAGGEEVLGVDAGVIRVGIGP